MIPSTSLGRCELSAPTFELFSDHQLNNRTNHNINMHIPDYKYKKVNPFFHGQVLSMRNSHTLYPNPSYLIPHTLYPLPLYPIPYTLYPIPYTLYLPCTPYPISRLFAQNINPTTPCLPAMPSHLPSPSHRQSRKGEFRAARRRDWGRS